MIRFESFALCAALVATPVVCQTTEQASSAPLAVHVDRTVVTAGGTATFTLCCKAAAAYFTVVASARPITAGSLKAAAQLTQHAVVVASGQVDEHGHARVQLCEPAGGGRWFYTALVVASAPAALHCSAAQSVLWLSGSGGPIGIDTPPTVTYSTQFGSAGNQSSRFMTTDENGSIYLAGKGGPLVNPPGDADPTGGTWIARLDPASPPDPNGDMTIAWTTNFGGDAEGMNRYDIVAGGGHVFVCGWASRGDLALGAVFDPTKEVFRDGYVAMFAADDGRRLATTYLSGQSGGNTTAQSMALIGDALYVTGWSDTGIWTTNGFDTTYDGGNDAFLLKLNVIAPAGPGLLGGIDLLWSTYLPAGGGLERAYAIAVDGLGSIYVTGDTNSDQLPFGGYQGTLGGNQDAFCLRILDGAAPQLVAGTYLGGSKVDGAIAVSLDASGDVWLGGTTASANFPITPGAYDNTLGGRADAFLARLSPDLSSLLSASYFGGSGDDTGEGLVTHAGLIYLVGKTKSADLPIVDPLPGFGSKSGREDAFFARLDGTGQPVTSTYFGGSSTDTASAGLEIDAAGTATFGGQMDSTDVPLIAPTSYGGDFYVARFEFAPPPPPPMAPSMLTATAVSSSAIDVSWTDNSSDESGFRIERSPDGVSWSTAVIVGTNTTSHTDTALAASTTYHYRAIAFNAGGDSPPSNVDSATTFSGPANPTITSIRPNAMDAGTTEPDVAIDGSGFQPGAVVSLSNGQGPAPSASRARVNGAGTQILVDITAGGGGPHGNRTWDVIITNPDQGGATLPGGFTVVK